MWQRCTIFNSLCSCFSPTINSAFTASVLMTVTSSSPWSFREVMSLDNNSGKFISLIFFNYLCCWCKYFLFINVLLCLCLLSILNRIGGVGNFWALVCVPLPKWQSSVLSGALYMLRRGREEFGTFRWVIVSILLTNTCVSCVGGSLENNLCSTVAVGAPSMCRYTVEKNFGGIPSVFFVSSCWRAHR